MMAGTPAHNSSTGSAATSASGRSTVRPANVISAVAGATVMRRYVAARSPIAVAGRPADASAEVCHSSSLR
jgi:hypothetical protein